MKPTTRPCYRPTLIASALALVLAAGCDEDDEPFVGADAAAGADGGGAGTGGGGGGAVAGMGGGGGAGAGGGAGGGVGGGAGAPAPNVVFAAVRLLPTNGAVDTAFGVEGIARIPLGAGANNLPDPALSGMALDPQDAIVLFGAKQHATRSDRERVVARLTRDGQLDTNFGTMGFTTFGIEGLNDSARTGVVQADGKILSSGYTSQPTGAGTQSANRILLARLLADGKLDTTFGSGGIVNSAPFVPAMPEITPWGMAEAYGVAVQSTGAYVTAGYGYKTFDPNATSRHVDLVAFRFNGAGQRDTTFGGQPDGAVVLDLAQLNDRGRNLIALADDRIFIVGTAAVSGTPMNAVEDAMAVMLTPSGAYDTAFYPAQGARPAGLALHDFNAVDEEFWGVARSPNNQWVAAVGYRGGAAGQNFDSIVLLQPLTAGAPPIVKTVPLSATGDDRLWAAAFDAQNRLYAAGSVVEGGDNWMAVARFGADGALDPTFGTGGVVRINVTPGAGVESARAISIQTDGKIVLAGPAAER